MSVEVEQLEYGGGIMPAPKFWTPRNPDRPTRGTRQAKFAKVWMRQPFMPWQQLVADVRGEVQEHPEIPGLWVPVYPLTVVTLQRQGGKSHLVMAKNGERCMSCPGHRAWYTAQTGADARDQFLKFHDDVVIGTPLERVVTTLRGNGHEVMRFPNGSTIRPHPPTEAALHGKQTDDEDIDEGWAFSEEEGKGLFQAVGPTQLTRPGAQIGVWSAGGTASSTWLAELVARGRAGDPGMAYFEWGIPDDFPLDDLEGIARYHPAYGHTVTVESIRALRTLLSDDAEFARAAGNRWTEVIGGVIPAALWKRARYEPYLPDDAPLGFGAARAQDGSEVAVAAAARVGDVVVVEILDVMPAHGAAPKVKAWAEHGPLAVDRVGPSANLADALDTAGRELLALNTRDVTAACANLVDGLEPGAVKFRPNAELDAAVKVAGKRRVGDGGWLWARVKSGASIATLEAATLAVWALEHRAEPAPKPRVYIPQAS